MVGWDGWREMYRVDGRFVAEGVLESSDGAALACRPAFEANLYRGESGSLCCTEFLNTTQHHCTCMHACITRPALQATTTSGHNLAAASPAQPSWLLSIQCLRLFLAQHCSTFKQLLVGCPRLASRQASYLQASMQQTKCCLLAAGGWRLALCGHGAP